MRAFYSTSPMNAVRLRTGTAVARQAMCSGVRPEAVMGPWAAANTALEAPLPCCPLPKRSGLKPDVAPGVQRSPHVRALASGPSGPSGIWLTETDADGKKISARKRCQPGMAGVWPSGWWPPGWAQADASAQQPDALGLAPTNPGVQAGTQCGPGERTAAAGKFILHPLHPKSVLAGSTHSSPSSCLVPPPFSSGEFP